MRKLLLATSLLCVPAALHAQGADSTAPAPAPAVTRAAVQSWTSDRRTYGVGDVITVIVDESTLAIRDRSESSAAERDTRMTLDGSMRTGAGSASGANVGIRTGSGGSSSERGQARRQDRLTAEITVRVTAVEPGGVLRVEGSKSLVIDGREQKVTLGGLVRAADIAPQNVIDSWRIADASIAYYTDGKLSQPKKSMIARILGMIWP